ncbi:MAG: Hsp20/alpha crystallin family protein [Megasphaera sp.]|jgi:HSP20 family protein|nr:Hsp20/alpha crystallin family protein [Megasphaera sp.]
MMKNLFPVVSANDFLFPNNVFDSFFQNFMQPADGSFQSPNVDIEDKGNEYLLKADLPGMTKEDVNLTYDNDVLTLSAQHEESKDEQDEKKNYIRKERRSSSFCRQFVVHNIQKDGIQASFEDGVLKVELPKTDQKVVDQSHRIAIQ